MLYRVQVGDQRVDARIILKSIFTQNNVKKYSAVSGTELCPRANWCIAASVLQRQRAGLWFPSSRVHIRPKPSDFQDEKILSTTSFGGEIKPSVPCCSFTACQKSLNMTWKSAFRQNSRTFLAHSFTFRRWVLSRGDTRGDAWWRNLERPTQIAQ